MKEMYPALFLLLFCGIGFAQQSDTLLAPKPFPFLVPDVLKSKVSQATYREWLNVKASSLRKRDLRLKKPFAAATPRGVYMQKLHEAVAAAGLVDPYSGDSLRWDQIGTWDPQEAKGNPAYKRQFALLPTADHIDPDAPMLAFEICSWVSNTAKTFLTPQEFVALCRKIVEHRLAAGMAVKGSSSMVPNYELPGYLIGVCTPAAYRKWLNTRAKQEYDRDLKLKRPCALHSSKALYKQSIHEAVCASDGKDPFTGEKLQWDRVNTWSSVARVPRTANQEKEFSLLPTVDHIDPDSDTVGFEICSWLVNDSKGELSAQEYVEYCRLVVAHAEGGQPQQKKGRADHAPTNPN